MLEAVDLEIKIPKEDYKERKDMLVEELGQLQQQAMREEVPVIIVFEGWEASGKGSRISDLAVNLDPRYFRTWSIGEPVGYEKRLPFMQRFWEKVGSHNTITIFDRSWYSSASKFLVENVQQKERKKAANRLSETLYFLGNTYGGDEASEAEALAASIASFEKQFADDGYIIVKFFLHITQSDQRKRLERLLSRKETAWRVTNEDMQQNMRYKRIYKVLDTFLEKTHCDYAPWHIIPGNDSRTANLEILEILNSAIKDGLEKKRAKKAAIEAGTYEEEPNSTEGLISSFPLVSVPSLDDVTYDNVIDNESYRLQLKAEQKKLREYSQTLYLERIPTIIAYEGWDAAGKGGNIKRVARALDARDYRVIPSAAPTWDEKHHPFLWRYWTNLPPTGHVGMYDRTWYGRVLVERVEGFATPSEWRRAYDEINEFEWELYQWGAIILKFWIDVSDEEQLRRFRDRENNPLKQWKITPDDWRNRDKNDLYRVAVNDMIRLTSTEYAPWQIIESDSKYFARVKALKAINAAIEKRLGIEPTE